MSKQETKKFREYLGTFDSKKMSSFDKKMLHAYLKGYTRFSYKHDEFGQPKWYDVKQRYIKDNKEEIIQA
jgi:hypothetical protein